MHLGIGDSFYLVGKVRDTYGCSLSLTWELLCDIMFAVSSCWRIGSCCLKIWICWSLLWTHKLPPPSSSKTPRRHHHHGGCCFLMKLDNNNHLQLKLKFGKPRPVLWTHNGLVMGPPLSFSAWLVCLARTVPVLRLQSLTKHLVPDRVRRVFKPGSGTKLLCDETFKVFWIIADTAISGSSEGVQTRWGYWRFQYFNEDGSLPQRQVCGMSEILYDFIQV